MNHPSLNLDRMDGMDERSAYEELIKENIGFDNLLRNYRYDHDRLQEIVDIILDVVCSCAQTIRINGEDIPVSVIKSRYLKLNDSHIEYVIDSMAKNPSDIRNIRAYISRSLLRNASAVRLRSFRSFKRHLYRAFPLGKWRSWHRVSALKICPAVRSAR